MLTRARRRLPWILLVVLVVVATVTIGYAAATSTVAFGPYTTTWEGTSDLRSMGDADDRELVVARNTSAYGTVESNTSVAFVFSPDERYGATDADRLAQFVEDGGTLVMAEAAGPHGNPLLEAVGAETRVDGDPLRDETHYDASPDFPETAATGAHFYVNDVETVVINHGSALELPEKDATRLLESSPYGYLDQNRDGELSDDEELARYPVGAVEDVGDGQVVILSDPSMFINVMLDRGDNRVFLSNLLEPHETVVFDISHGEALPPLALALLVFRESLFLQLTVAGVGVAGIWGIFHTRLPHRLRDRWEDRQQAPQGPGFETDTLTEAVMTAHPQWDRDRAERVIETIQEDERD